MTRPDRAEFFAALDAKLDAGSREHGDGSFARPAHELVGELEAEALDLAGWGYILWARLRALREAAQTAELPRSMRMFCTKCEIEVGALNSYKVVHTDANGWRSYVPGVFCKGCSGG